MELIERESEILRILGRLKATSFIVVGGYAVSSLTVHRFSVDCDIVVSAALGKITSILKEEGYTLQTKKEGFDVLYGGRFERYVKKINKTSVSVDVLVNSLVSRGTDASWSFDYIRKHSVISEIGTPPVRFIVPERELLVAMKIHSGRGTDIRDIIMLREGCDKEKVVGHLARGNTQLLRERIQRLLDTLGDEKLVDSLKGVFRLKRDVEMDIEKTRIFATRIEKLLPQP